MRAKINIGSITHLINRQRVDILMVFVVVPWMPRIIANPRLLLWGLVLISILAISVYVDMRWIIGREWGYIFRKNGEWRKLKEDIEEIKEKLEAK